ncbi:MAG: DUF4091 domain-containing protein [Kiritimatiellae bacterium]|nr:DUF4091 domain-containing protein [Kiritimatiellia bacterium]
MKNTPCAASRTKGRIAADNRMNAGTQRHAPYSSSGSATDCAISVADALTKVFPDGKVFGNELAPAENGVRLEAARGEVVSFQVVLGAPARNLKSVAVEVESPRQGERSLASEVYRIGFVQTQKTKYATLRGPGWYPDPLFPNEPIELPLNAYRPFWINVVIPEEAEGTYQGTVFIRSGGNTLAAIPIDIQVWKIILPRQMDIFHALDFSLADKVSGFHKLYGRLDGTGWEPFARYMRYLQSHKINAFFYTHFLWDSGLVDVEQKEERYVCNLARTRKVLDLMERLGLAGNLWSTPIWYDPKVLFDIYPFIERFRALGEKVYFDEEFVRFLVEVSADLHKKLSPATAKRWFAYVWDEPRDPSWHFANMKLLSERLKQAAPAVRQLTAIGHTAIIDRTLEEKLPIDIIIGHMCGYTEDLVRRVRDSGRKYFWYTSNWSSSFLSFWIDEPAVNHRALYWLTWRYDVPGFGYWNSNTWNYTSYGYHNVDEQRTLSYPFSNWNVNPHNSAGSGDGQLFYPGPDGPIGSLRMEVIRHGCQDHQLLSELSRRAAHDRRASEMVARVRSEIGGLVTCDKSPRRRYSIGPVDLLRLRNEVGRFLNGNATGY